MKKKTLSIMLGLLLVISMLGVVSATHTSTVEIVPNEVSPNTEAEFTFKVTNFEGDLIKKVQIDVPSRYSNIVCGNPPINWAFSNVVIPSSCIYRTTTSLIAEGESKTFTLKTKTPSTIGIDKFKIITIDIGAILDTNILDVETKSGVVPPTPPQPSGFAKFIQSIIDWIKDLFSQIFGLQSIVGPQVVEPNTQHTYQIDLVAPIPDSDWSDGTYQIQYANWALVDKLGNIIQQGTWEEVNGAYTKSVTITTPSEIDNFMLVGIITQFDMNFNFNTNEWITSEEEILNKEAIDLKTEYSIIEPEVPIPGGFQKFINAIVDWFRNLWSSIFG